MSEEASTTQTKQVPRESRIKGLTAPEYDGVTSGTLGYWLRYWSGRTRDKVDDNPDHADPELRESEIKKLTAEIEARKATRSISQGTPLFVRIPREQADRLDRASADLGTPKSRLVADLVARHLGAEDPPVGIDSLRGAPVGRHSFAAVPEAEVLTLEQLASLLELDLETVSPLAEQGDIPGRKLGEEWRFSRAAILAWLGGE